MSPVHRLRNLLKNPVSHVDAAIVAYHESLAEWLFDRALAVVTDEVHVRPSAALRALRASNMVSPATLKLIETDLLSYGNASEKLRVALENAKGSE